MAHKMITVNGYNFLEISGRDNDIIVCEIDEDLEVEIEIADQYAYLNQDDIKALIAHLQKQLK